jgi:hypothetical protein
MTLVSLELRQMVFERAGGLCEYCRLSQVTQVATFPVDHVLPISAGGKTEQDNLALACPRCNAAKWTHTSVSDPQSGELIRLYDPRRDNWSDHFQWSVTDPTWLEARSSTARGTIELLDLNSQHRRQVRHWLIVLGLHPPARPNPEQ